MKRSLIVLFTILSLMLFTLFWPAAAQAAGSSPALTVSTDYPSEVVQLGESVNFSLNLQASDLAQTVDMSMEQMPEGWSATFRGGSHIIQSVFVAANASGSVDLRLDPPENAKPGTYTFMVLAQSETSKVELPLSLTVQEQVPASLSFTTDLPTIKGSPSSTFRYTTTLKNDGNQDLTVNLTADAPAEFVTKFMLSGQEVTSFPVGANQSKTISVELTPLSDISAGEYPFTVYADAGDLQADLNLDAQVTGEYTLGVSGPDGRLSGNANAGKATTFQVVVNNTGTAPAQGIEMSATAPSGWTVSFDPKVIDQIPAGNQVQVTANLTPADKAVAGDYIVTVHAKPVDGSTKSADFRITVSTSTLWGIAGIALIAVAVGVVAMAVTRFGRR
ncbi:MAG: NEW3 domain-containing protein [Anaerolineales bacterium]|jgi:uncharacterized repeat protein (TIGR01451 family)